MMSTACGSSDPTDAGPGDGDGGPGNGGNEGGTMDTDAGPDSGGMPMDYPWPAVDGKGGWLTGPTPNDAGNGSVDCFDVTYSSQAPTDEEALVIDGQYCRPKAPGKYPILMVNHGIFAYRGSMLASFAAMGFAAFESGYRGDGLPDNTEDGEITLCLDEAFDVRRMLAIVEELSDDSTIDFVDMDQIAMVGFSHGGCITMRAIAAEYAFHGEGRIDAAVDIFGPSDIEAVYRLWKKNYANILGSGQSCDNILLKENPFCVQMRKGITLTETIMGGTPDEVPEEYARHASLAVAEEIEKVDTPILIVHGVKDVIVPVSDSCRLVGELSGFDAWHLNAGSNVVTSDPAGCGELGIAWKDGTAPTTTFASDRTLIIYDDATHDVNPVNIIVFSAQQGPQLLARAKDFLTQHMLK
ncbi:MAG: prolyl oligopeptidase family serine peptidase [Myxococcales bacterium]|nr:prolyl oligopeptidase family serine peptidase [Myxococcales bacterium]